MFSLEILARTVASIAAVVVAAGSLPPVQAQGARLPAFGEDCKRWMNDSFAAANSEDWPAVEAIDLKRLQRCAFNEVSRADALASLAEALEKQGKFEEGLKAATECVSLWYREVNCQIRLVALHAQLGNRDAATVQFRTSAKLLDREMEVARKALKDSEADLRKASSKDREQAEFDVRSAKTRVNILESNQTVLYAHLVKFRLTP